MQIIMKYIFTNLKEHKTRTIVMLLSIVLSSTLLFVSLSIGASYEGAQRKKIQGFSGTAALSVTAVENGKTVDAEDVPELTAIKHAAGILKASALYHENGFYEEVDLIAADLEKLSNINKPRMADEGEITGFNGNKIILPYRFTSQYGIKEGDTITLKINGKPVNFQVSDIAAYDSIFLRSTRGVNGLVPLDTLSGLLKLKDSYSEVLMEPVKGVTNEQLKTELMEKLPPGKYRVSIIIKEAQLAKDAREKSMPLYLISFFALTMSVFIIYSSYKVITLERLPIIGTFRSIGATKKTVKYILLAESLLYGILGGIIGIPIGMFVQKIMLRGMGNSALVGIEIPVTIPSAAVILTIAEAIIVSLIGSYIPIRRAGRIPLKELVLGLVEVKTVPNRRKFIIGIILVITSIVLPRVVSENQLIVAGGFSLLGMIVGTIIIIPPVTTLTASLLERIYGTLLGNEGRLAARNMKNNNNITQNITLLFISLSSIIAISVTTNFISTYIGDIYHDAKLEGFADGRMDQDFAGKVKEIEGMEQVLPLYGVDNKVNGNGITFTQFEAVDDIKLYNSMLGVKYDTKTMEEQAAASFEKERVILLSSDFMKKSGFSIGDTLKLTLNGKSFDYKVIGRIRSRADSTEAVIPAEYFIKDFGSVDYNRLVYTAADPDAAIIQIRDLFGETTNFSRSVKEFYEGTLGTVNAFLAPVRNLTYFILLLAMVGIVNNLLINYIQKRRAIAIYKSIGLSNRQNIRITLVEGFTSGLLGAMFGIIVSYLEILTIYLVTAPKVSIQPEWDIRIFFMVGLEGIAVTLVGSVVPIVKGTKMKLIEEIKSE